MIAKSLHGGYDHSPSRAVHDVSASAPPRITTRRRCIPGSILCRCRMQVYKTNVCIHGVRTRSSATAEITAVGRCVYTLMLHTRLASAVAVCIAIRGRYTQLAWLANPNPNPNPTNSSYG